MTQEKDLSLQACVTSLFTEQATITLLCILVLSDSVRTKDTILYFQNRIIQQ